MKIKAGRLFKAVLILTILFFVTAAIFLVVAMNGDLASVELKEYLNSRLSNSEAVYMIIGFSVSLLIAMTVLAVSVILPAAPIVKRYGGKKKSKKRKTARPSRFSMLTRIDREEKKAEAYSTKPLDELCEGFRNYAAGKLGLYYDIADIRRFIAGMGISKLVILKGMSGTGKTSLAYAAGEYFKNPSTVVPIQPMWKERSDMIGYFNEFTKKFNETTMLCKLYEAGGKGDVYITVLDEVNISRIEYYFAEFLSLLELPDPKRRYLDVVADTWKTDPERLQNGKLLLPENMWFIGTANNDDSTFAISDKVYDRAAVMDLERKCTPFVAENDDGCHISYAELTRLFAEAKQKYTLSSESREKLLKLDEYMREVFKISFGNRIMKQIEEYIPIMIACGGSEAQALDDILARKILRKLEQLSPAYVKSESDALIALMEELFGINVLPMSCEYIEKLQKGF